jgi:hypothetical protein
VGNNVNNNMRNFSTGTRFLNPTGFIDFTGNTPAAIGLWALNGAGALVNLTTGNLNWIARVLQSEFSADVIAAPQVLTLNGQNVEFVTGQRVPFVLGQNVTTGATTNVQQFFYKHVGTYISVTPQIVDWGLRGGKAPLVATEIPDWHQLIHALLAMNNTAIVLKPDLLPKLHAVVGHPGFPRALPVELSLQAEILEELNRYAKEDLVRIGLPIAARVDALGGCDGSGCDWRPEDCTIDMEIVMRLSDAGTIKVGVSTPGTGAPQEIDVTQETNVRAIANIVQVKSGHGVVMGGLINEHDIEEVTKVPVLGDIPVVGHFFRSKAGSRRKTEIVLFVEAEVLHPHPPVARAQSARDFLFSQAYVAGTFLDNPLEFGMYRAGFGSYLPPHSCEEKVFWERFCRKVRTIATTLDDVFE